MMGAVSAASPLSPSALEQLQHSFMTAPFNRLLGIEFGQYHEDGVTLQLSLLPHHLNGAGVVHGGVMLTLADAALGFGIARATGRRCTTAEIKINYLRPVTEGVLSARSRILRAGRKLVVARAEVFCGDKHVAEVLTTFAVVN